MLVGSYKFMNEVDTICCNRVSCHLYCTISFTMGISDFFCQRSLPHCFIVSSRDKKRLITFSPGELHHPLIFLLNDQKLCSVMSGKLRG